MNFITFDSSYTAVRYGANTHTAPTHAARRGAYVLPHQCQQTGRDLEGERCANRPRSLLAYQTTPQYRQQVSCPYLWIVQTTCCTAVTAFHAAGELLDWCRAYAVSLTPYTRGFADFMATTGSPEDWQPLTVELVQEPAWT